MLQSVFSIQARPDGMQAAATKRSPPHHCRSGGRRLPQCDYERDRALARRGSRAVARKAGGICRGEAHSRAAGILSSF